MKKIKIILFSITFITFIFSCQTVPKQEKLQHDEFQTNLANYTLENGLPVVLKNSPESKVFTLEIYFPFGASNLDESNYGYLSFLLNLLTIENKNITREKMTEILDEKLADISYGSASDYCFIRMTCLSKYFDDIFKIFSDCVLYPSYKSFELMKSQSQFNFLNTKYIDYNLLMKKSGEKIWSVSKTVIILHRFSPQMGRESDSKKSSLTCLQHDRRSTREREFQSSR